MQIVIPMTGYGSRFKAQGYDRLKPFIEVQGAPMIEWVVRLFTNYEHQITFVCQAQHLEELSYIRPELERIAPKATIFGVEDWTKKGPVVDVLCASELIADDQPVLVSYCDFFMLWDFASFINEAAQRDCDGAIPCYSGFHPHLLPKDNVYASCKVDKAETLIEIREKFSWTADRSQTRHSPGVYYFRTGALLKHYYTKLTETNSMINGEFYSSLPYNLMVKDGHDVWCPVNVHQFCQWGTPYDLDEYLYWTNVVRDGMKQTLADCK